MEMAGSMPFGVKWPATAALKDRRAREHESFVAWIHDLDVPEDQRKILAVLLGMVDDSELVDGRCAGVTYAADARRHAGALDDVDTVNGILHGLEAAGYLSLHPASDVFKDNRPGIVCRLRRPDVVRTVESAGQPWLANAWPRKSVAVLVTGALAGERGGHV